VVGRAIDQALQRRVKASREAGASWIKLSLFPTPRVDYFLRQIAVRDCKPHLRSFGCELFNPGNGDPGPPNGGNFTRFMLAGFAAYRALDHLGITTYEGYPYLQFRLWSDQPLPPKKTRIAMDVRKRILLDVSKRAEVELPAIDTLDQADAAILALSAFAVSSGACGWVVEHPAEGRFWLTLPAALG